MRHTTRDNWRVVAVVNPKQTRVSIKSFGFTDAWGDPLEGQLWGDRFEFTVLPQRLGDVGMGISMSDSFVSRDIEGDYRKRCEVIRDGLLRHVSVVEARIECDETHTCSHCGRVWEELTEEDAADPANLADLHSIVGEPVCCTAAINEFRAERGIEACST